MELFDWQGPFYAHNLENRILALLIQLPPSMGIVEGMNRLRNIIPELDKSFRYVVEVKTAHSFRIGHIVFFANNNMCMVWIQSCR